MTVAHSLAVAVLKGDMVAALALCDKVKEEATHNQQSFADLCEESFQSAADADDGYTVYSWPEFRAFCKRAGFMWNLRTRGVTFRVFEGEPVVFTHEYIGTDLPENESIDATTMHNELFVTRVPREHADEPIPE